MRAAAEAIGWWMMASEMRKWVRERVRRPQRVAAQMTDELERRALGSHPNCLEQLVDAARREVWVRHAPDVARDLLRDLNAAGFGRDELAKFAGQEGADDVLCGGLLAECLSAWPVVVDKQTPKYLKLGPKPLAERGPVGRALVALYEHVVAQKQCREGADTVAARLRNTAQVRELLTLQR